MQLPKYCKISLFLAQTQRDNSHYKYTTSLPPEVDRAIARGAYTKRMSLIVDRAIVAAELRYELEFGGLDND